MSSDSERIHRIELTDLIVHRWVKDEETLRKADGVARSVISNEMRESEIFRRTRDKIGSYVLIFPRLTPEAGALRCSLIGDKVVREIRRHNIGAPANHAASPAKAQAKKQRSPIQRRDPKSSRAVPGARAIAERKEKEVATRAVARMVEAAGIPVHDMAFSVRDREALNTIDIGFRPIWHVRKAIITGYRCEMTSRGKPATPESIRSLLDSAPTDIQNLKIDVAAYAQAVNAAQALLQRGLKALMLVSIHFSTIEQPRLLSALLGPAASLPESARNLIVIELIDVPRNVSRFRLRDGLQHVRSNVRALIARAPYDISDLTIFHELNFHSVSIDLGQHRLREADTLAAFLRLGALADKHRLRLYAHGVAHSSLAVGAIGAGFTYLDGPAIADSVTTPDSIQPFKLAQIYLPAIIPTAAVLHQDLAPDDGALMSAS